MGRLTKEALRFPESGEPMDSAEIDRVFNESVDTLARRIAEERRQQELQTSVPEPAGTQYYLQGHFLEDGIPIPLEESFRATSLEEAQKKTREMTMDAHNLEGYAVNMSLFDTLNYPRKVLYSFRVPVKKE